jgi:hypothetical protein
VSFDICQSAHVGCRESALPWTLISCGGLPRSMSPPIPIHPLLPVTLVGMLGMDVRGAVRGGLGSPARGRRRLSRIATASSRGPLSKSDPGRGAPSHGVMGFRCALVVVGVGNQLLVDEIAVCDSISVSENLRMPPLNLLISQEEGIQRLI